MTVFDRHGVGDFECGVVSTARSSVQAQGLARVHSAESSSGAEVEFFDGVARVGRLNRWTPAGGVKEYKPVVDE